jgi:hypothetical protein
MMSAIKYCGKYPFKSCSWLVISALSIVDGMAAVSQQNVVGSCGVAVGIDFADASDFVQ